METMNVINGSVYLDYNATTPLEADVLETIQSALRDAWGNPSSCYEQGKKAKTIIENSRKSVASMIGGSADDVIFTSGGTEANNMVIQTGMKFYWKTLQELAKKGQLVDSHQTQPLPHIITSNLEHDSVKLVLECLEKESQIEVSYVPASQLSGRVEVDDIVAAIKPNTCMITLMLANNETGVIQPVKEVCQRIKQMQRKLPEFPRILLHTDAAQAIGKIPVHVQELGVDYLTVVGHKFYAPRIGALYVSNLRKGTPVYPMLYGGGQECNYRPGTENTGMIAGLGKAAELVTENLSEYERHMRDTRDYLEKRLEEEFQVHINGRFEASERLPNTCNVSFLMEGLIGSRVLAACQYLQASIGAACHSHDSLKPSPILVAIGIPEDVAANAVRLSVGRQTTKEDIELVITDLKQATQQVLQGDVDFDTSCTWDNHDNGENEEMDDPERRCMCRLCGKRFKSLTNLRSHERVHGNDRPFKCTQCDWQFKFQHTLNRHVKGVHENKRTFKCDIGHCTKVFTNKCYLEKHKRSSCHQGFQCETCGKKFEQQYFLDSHKVECAEREPIKCDVCGRLYTRKDSLARHKRAHAAKMRKPPIKEGFRSFHVEPYICSLCGERVEYRYHAKYCVNRVKSKKKKGSKRTVTVNDEDSSASFAVLEDSNCVNVCRVKEEPWHSQEQQAAGSDYDNGDEIGTVAEETPLSLADIVKNEKMQIIVKSGEKPQILIKNEDTEIILIPSSPSRAADGRRRVASEENKTH